MLCICIFPRRYRTAARILRVVQCLKYYIAALHFCRFFVTCTVFSSADRFAPTDTTLRPNTLFQLHFGEDGTFTSRLTCATLLT